MSLPESLEKLPMYNTILFKNLKYLIYTPSSNIFYKNLGQALTSKDLTIENDTILNRAKLHVKYIIIYIPQYDQQPCFIIPFSTSQEFYSNYNVKFIGCINYIPIYEKV